MDRIDELIDAWDSKLRRAFIAAVHALRDRAQVSLVVERLEKGDVAGALAAVDLDPIAFRSFESTIAQAFEDGGRATIDRVPALKQPDGFRLSIEFDVRNLRAEGWLRDHSGKAVTEILADQRDMVRSALVAGMEAGRNPRSVALDLVGRINAATGRREGGLIGLTSSQEVWVRGFAQELADVPSAAALDRKLRDKRFDSAIRKAIAEQKPLPAELREKMLVAYRNRALRLRAETIARTEAMVALHESQSVAMQAAIQSGAIDEDQVAFVWRTARDARVRDTHRTMNGQRAVLGQPFISGSGARIRYPGDPAAPAAEVINCRCWREPKIDYLRGIR